MLRSPALFGFRLKISLQAPIVLIVSVIAIYLHPPLAREPKSLKAYDRPGQTYGWAKTPKVFGGGGVAPRALAALDTKPSATLFINKMRHSSEFPDIFLNRREAFKTVSTVKLLTHTQTGDIRRHM